MVAEAAVTVGEGKMLTSAVAEFTQLWVEVPVTVYVVLTAGLTDRVALLLPELQL